MTGALGESDGFAVAPHGSGPLPAGAEVDLLRRVAVNLGLMGLMGDWLRGKRMKDPVRGTRAGRGLQPHDAGRGGVQHAR